MLETEFNPTITSPAAARRAQWNQLLKRTRDWMFTSERLPARGLQFLRLLVQRFIEDQGLLQAASLTYTTLLSLVPLMTVTLAAFSAFPISERIADQIQVFIFDNFVPASGETIRGYILDFSAKASRLSGIGFLFLILVALMLMSNIDRALNRIWRTTVRRSLVSTFLEYWAILTLGPVLIGSSVAVTSYLVSSSLLGESMGRHMGVDPGVLLRLAPMAASAVGFTLLYAIVPNRRVPFRHALAGGLLAALLFELTKRGFAFYVTQFPTYEAIYGAMAVVPIFLVWIYLCWMVTLLGAEFSCCLGIFHDRETLLGRESSSDLLLAFQVLKRLWQAQQQGEALSTRELSRRLSNISEERIDAMLNELQQHHYVARDEHQDWLLARNAADLRLYDLFRAGNFSLPQPADLRALRPLRDPALEQLLLEVDQQLAQRMHTDLHSLFLQPGEAPNRAPAQEGTPSSEDAEVPTSVTDPGKP